MVKKVITAGLAGGLTLMLWSILINGILGFRYRMDMKQVPGEREVYEVLKQHIVEPGRYLCNPAVTESHTYPENEPVFSILYGGMGHEAAGPLSLILDFLYALITATLCAWLLSMTSDKIITSYPRKVLFVFILALLFAAFSDTNNYGIGNYPLGDALIIALHNIVLWTLLGAVISIFIKPVSEKAI
jgi:hypothetical protein